MSASGFAGFIVGGFLVILAAWIPLFLSGTFVSLPMIAVAIGLVCGATDLVKDPMSAYSTTAETIAEFALLVAVLGTRIDAFHSVAGEAYGAFCSSSCPCPSPPGLLPRLNCLASRWGLRWFWER